MVAKKLTSLLAACVLVTPSAQADEEKTNNASADKDPYEIFAEEQPNPQNKLYEKGSQTKVPGLEKFSQNQVKITQVLRKLVPGEKTVALVEDEDKNVLARIPVTLYSLRKETGNGTYTVQYFDFGKPGPSSSDGLACWTQAMGNLRYKGRSVQGMDAGTWYYHDRGLNGPAAVIDYAPTTEKNAVWRGIDLEGTGTNIDGDGVWFSYTAGAKNEKLYVMGKTPGDEYNRFGVVYKNLMPTNHRKKFPYTFEECFEVHQENIMNFLRREYTSAKKENRLIGQ